MLYVNGASMKMDFFPPAFFLPNLRILNARGLRRSRIPTRVISRSDRHLPGTPRAVHGKG